MTNRSAQTGILAWFAGNSVAANILMIALVLAGAYTIQSMRTEVFPQIDPRTIVVTVPYSGANPEEVEDGITTRVESAVTGITGVKRISSTASEGLGRVTVELISFAAADDVLADVRDAVDQISDFPPEGADDPSVEKTAIEPTIMTLALYGAAPERQLREVGERLRDELLATNQVADVVLNGVRSYEMSIEVSEQELQRFGLSFETIAQKISAASLDLAGGTLRTANGEILLRTPAKRVTAEEFERTPILTQADGATVLLSEVATIRDGFEDGELINVYNGEPSVFLTIYRTAEQGAIEVENVVTDYLAQASVPAGMTLEIRDNDTDALRERINLMLRNAIFGFGLVFLSLVLFLDLKLAFWTSLAIPISFLGGLAIAGYLGASINMISLFALIIVLGVVVDDAVVVGENIFHAQAQGKPPFEATLDGLREVAAPVTLGVLTTIMAFAPLAFTTGTLGQVISVIPIVVIAILFISLVESLLILPAHLSGGSEWSVGPLKLIQRGFTAALEGFTAYIVRPVVAMAVTFRYATMVLIIAIVFIAATAFSTGFLRFVFFPPTEADRVELTLTMTEGAPFSTTRTAAETALAAAAAVDARIATEHESTAVAKTSATIGQSATASGPGGAGGSSTASNIAQIRVELTPSDLRNVGSVEFEQMWRDEIGALPGAESMTFMSGLFVLGDDVSVEMSHADEELLLGAAEALRARLDATNGVSDIEFSLQFGKRQLDFSLNDVGIALGLSDADLARQIRRAFFGEQVQTLQRGLEEVDVIVRYPQAERTSLGDVYDMRIRLAGGEAVPVTAVADIVESRGFSTIERSDGRRILRVTAKVDSDVTTSDNVNNDLRNVFLPELTQDIDGLQWAMSGQAADQQTDLQNIFGALGVAMLGIFVMLAGFTRSYIVPIVILTTVIYGVVGAVAGHIALGYPLTFISLFGIVALAGVVVNDSILLLDDYTRRLKREPHLAKAKAIVDSAARRFRPILMTTISTAFGLLPMIYETSFQAKFLIPMAISLGFGIIVATPILLMAVPATMMILDDLGRPFRWFRRSIAATGPAPGPAE